MKWYLHALRHYASFRGTASRREYIGFLLVQLCAIALISFLERTFALANPEIGMGWLTALYLLLTLLPGLALATRRLHDTGHSGWWLLLCLLPPIGLLFMFGLALPKGGSATHGHLQTATQPH